jgi:hypothetical protein
MLQIGRRKLIIAYSYSSSFPAAEGLRVAITDARAIAVPTVLAPVSSCCSVLTR